MTIEELSQVGGIRYYRASGGESLVWVCRRLYGVDGWLYRRVLRVLNPGLNWFSLGVGDVVSYLGGDRLSGVSVY